MSCNSFPQMHRMARLGFKLGCGEAEEKREFGNADIGYI